MNHHLFYSLFYIREKSPPVSVVVVIDYEPTRRSPVNLWKSVQQGIRDLEKMTAEKESARQIFWRDDDNTSSPLVLVSNEGDMQEALSRETKEGNAKFFVFQEETEATAATKDLSAIFDGVSLC